MKRSFGWFWAVCGLGLAAACSGSGSDPSPDDADPADAATIDHGGAGTSASVAGSGGSAQNTAPMPNACDSDIAASVDGLPNSLECTGLYANMAMKTLADGVQAYAPAYPLWSDGSEKERWIYLPPGTNIDTSDMGKWSFPIGTKLFKQFSAGGKRVETRMYQKIPPDGDWSHATYVWNAGETAAMRTTAGATITVARVGAFAGNGTYRVPTQRDCDQCHEGRVERILGFEAVSLGLDGATGLTLDQLVSKKLLTSPPAQTHLTIGDDGTGAAAPALAWMHINCGVSCHNDLPSSEAYQTLLRLRLDPKLLDGRSSKGFDSVTSTVGAAAKTTRWVGQTRIVAGAPAQSLLYKLITSRAGKTQQMPPLASVAVDTEHDTQISTWISRMTPGN